MNDLRRFGPATMVAVASLAAVFAVSWRAAEEHRGLDLTDLRTVLFVAASVFASAAWLDGGRWPFRRRLAGPLPAGFFDRFGPAARSAIQAAQQEARRLQHNYIGTEHLLLGILAAPESPAGGVLRARGVDAALVRGRIEALIGRGTEPAAENIGLTPRSKRSIDAAIDVATKWGDATIDDRHLLVGLMRQEGAFAAGLLVAVGVDLPDLRRELSAARRRSE